MDNKRRIKLTIEYDGTGFFGWQIQSKTKERTIQGELQNALAKLPGEYSSIKGAGRTDAGVHAIAMTAHWIPTLLYQIKNCSKLSTPT